MTEQNRDDMEGVMRRIQKLLAIAEDSRANPAEAAAAASMAEKVMRKYQLDRVDFINKELKTGQGMKRMQTSANMKRDDPSRPPLRKNPAWAGWLGFRVAKLNDCEVRFTWGSGAAVVEFFGYEADVQVAVWMFDYMVGALINSAKAYQKAAKRSKAESESYRRGFVLAVCANLQRLKQQKDEEIAAERAKGYAGSYSLVVSKAQAIEEHFGKVSYGTTKSVSTRDENAFAAGREAGNKVDVNRRGIGSNATSNAPAVGETRRLK